MTSDPKTNTNKSKSKNQVKRYLPLIGLIGVMIVGLVVGSAIVWEKRLEELVKVDLPHEDQETSEVSSLVPYICDRDPEACKNKPLTFKGYDHKSSRESLSEESKVEAELELEGDSEWPTVHYPEEEQSKEGPGLVDAFMNIPLMKEMEEKFEAINHIEPMQQKVEILGVLAVLDSVMRGQVSSQLLESALQNSKFEDLKELASYVPAGKLTPFAQLDVYEVVPPKSLETEGNSTIWDGILAWGASLIEIKTQDDVQAEKTLEKFKETCESGDYDRAFVYYEQMTPIQRQAYGSWASEIRKRKKLLHLNERLLQLLVREAE